MRRELNKLPIDGTVVIGEGECDEAPMLFIGEKVGAKGGPKVDIAVDPLEGTTLCAKNMPGAIATIAMAEGGTLLHAPDVYMDKIAVGPGYPKDVIDLDAPADENIRKLAKAKGVKPEGITALLLDRPRHADMIAAVRKTGAAGASDHRWRRRRRDPHRRPGKDRHRHLSSASAARRKACWRRPLCAASAARCNAGSSLDTDEKRERVAKMGIKDPRKKYQIEDMVRGDCLFAATGVTDGRMLQGVRFGNGMSRRETVVMRSVTGTVRWIRAEHRQLEKF